MKTFEYTLKAENGLHARPAGLLVTHAKNSPCRILIRCKGKEADAKRLISVMGLGAKQGDVLSFTLEGVQEEESLKQLQAFCREQL